MRADPVAENVLGTMGTVCWMGQLIPQIWKSWRERSTEGLSAYLMLMWAISAIFLGVYTITRNINIPLIVQPQLFGALGALSWTQCLYYTHKRSLHFCIFVYALYCIIGGGLETGMFFIARNSLNKGNPHPVQAFGTISAVVMASGLLPQYWEIWKRKEVVGVSYIFFLIDILGGIFSILSLALKAKFDEVAAVTYASVVFMDSLVLVAAVILNPMARRRRAQAQCGHKAVDSNIDSEKAVSIEQ